MQAEKEKEMEEEAKNISFENHGAKSMDLEEGDVEEEEEEEKKHRCSECGNGFKSGKALGGHIKIHGKQVRPKMVYSGIVGRSETCGFEVACCVCPKKFTSLKALFGHMRVHPDRGWKGVLPPLPPHPPGNSSSSTLSAVDKDDDDDNDDDDENSELLENVFELKGCPTRGKRSVFEVDETDLKDPQSEDLDTKNLLFLANIAEADNLNVAETSESQSEEVMMKKKKKMKRRLSEIEKISAYTDVAAAEEGGAGAREKHVCVTCNKSFTSYQALGGHRGSHSKVKILMEKHEARAANGEASLLGTEAIRIGLASGQGSITSLSSTCNNGNHICNICHRSFLTGQALGGHMRCHWSAPASAEAVTSAPTTGPASGSSSQVTETVHEVKKMKRTFLDFDLNELPPEEEEEEAEERV